MGKLHRVEENDKPGQKGDSVCDPGQTALERSVPRQASEIPLSGEERVTILAIVRRQFLALRQPGVRGFRGHYVWLCLNEVRLVLATKESGSRVIKSWPKEASGEAQRKRQPTGGVGPEDKASIKINSRSLSSCSWIGWGSFLPLTIP